MTSYTHEVKIFTFVKGMATYCIDIATKYRIAALMLTHVVHSMKAYNCTGCGILNLYRVWLITLVKCMVT